MLNQLVIVGRLTKDIEVKTLENGKTVSNITLAIPRSYRNENGEYDTDFLDCVLWDGIAKNTSEYCRKGDLLGVKGRMTNRIDKDNNRVMEIVAEKVTFLSTRKDVNESSYEEDIKI